MRPLLVVGPDSTLADVHSLAVQKQPGAEVQRLHIPSTDYYRFDLKPWGNSALPNGMYASQPTSST